MVMRAYFDLPLTIVSFGLLNSPAIAVAGPSMRKYGCILFLSGEDQVASVIALAERDDVELVRVVLGP